MKHYVFKVPGEEETNPDMEWKMIEVENEYHTIYKLYLKPFLFNTIVFGHMILRRPFQMTQHKKKKKGPPKQLGYVPPRKET
ncbi:hypothetical protein CDAR_105461 [Caerostris darwini]|uniref:Uncharacterized protein n=1 Tax=Caerostris darwini TaxID=1538125 RepID=A0AAV4MXH0_9ARAC|nr:hypothetical protein CDAR_105461 [Caerostris darwini]